MKTLHLNLKKKWFDMILNGIKKEEYREMKPYWDNRLINQKLQTRYDVEGSDIAWKEYDTITFSNGYSKNRKQMVVELKEIDIAKGNPEWGAVGDTVYYVLRLGNVLEINL